MATRYHDEEPGRLYRLLREDVSRNLEHVLKMIRKEDSSHMALTAPSIQSGRMALARPSLPPDFHPPTSKEPEESEKEPEEMHSLDSAESEEMDFPAFTGASPFPQDDWKALAGSLRRRRKKSAPKKKSMKSVAKLKR